MNLTKSKKINAITEILTITSAVRPICLAINECNDAGELFRMELGERRREMERFLDESNLQ
jgi:hypothetical protein